MGHTRLGTIPKTRKWIDVIKTIATSDNVGVIATKTLQAAQVYLETAIHDLGLRYTFYLLTQIALASRDNDWNAKLARIGITLSKDASLLEFTAEFQSAIDEYLSLNCYSSDISEIAQQAAGEALTYLTAPKSVTLFGAGSDELRASVREFSNKKGFSQLGQKFFGTFIARFINFYLSRITAAQLGNPNLPHIGELTRFNEALQLHCEQSAKIVHDFCGEWYSKTEYLKGIDQENSSKFLAVALKKLHAELKIQEADI
jgi:hypothetical protein